MKNFYIPIILLLSGLVAMVFSFVYYAANALPYQDVTIEQLAYQAEEATKYTVIFWFGFILSALAVYLIRVQLRARKKHKR